MPIGFGLASSHGSPAFFKSGEEFAISYQRIIETTPIAPQAATETLAVLDDWVQRINQAYTTLREQLAKYEPELLVIIGGDQTEMFDPSNVPNLMIYMGNSAWAYNTRPDPGRRTRDADYLEEDLVTFRVDSATSQMLLERLVICEGFDVAFSDEQRNLGKPGMGLPHAFHRPTPRILPELDVPVVLIYENTYNPPALSAARCYRFGESLARLLMDDPRRIAIFGSGGLSHAFWPATGWVDERLDRWILKEFAAGNGIATTAMFGHKGRNMGGGTGEIRSWITVAGAMEAVGSTATVVDYIPAAHAIHGLAWAYWPQPMAHVANVAAMGSK